MVTEGGDGRPGSYAILLRPTRLERVAIGRLGTLEVRDGIFVYCGSALGPGGVSARCAHHRRIAARPHWHLDYLRPLCEVIGIRVAYGPERLEHSWALAASSLPGACLPMTGFGASDCRCRSHLVWLPPAVSMRAIGDVLGPGEWLEPPEADSL